MNLKRFLVEEEKTIFQLMEQLNQVAKKILFISKDNRLVATVTDGDIRRWILKKGDLNSKIKEIANYNPKYLFEADKSKATEFMKRNSIEAVPIVDRDMIIHSIVFWDEKEIHNREIINAPMVMMAGGFGTRLYPYTKILPKPLMPIGEIPIAEHIINRFNEFGCKEFFLIVNNRKNMIKAYFNEVDKDYTISYADEDEPLGTGGGLSLLKGKIDSTFILSNCDILIEEDYNKIFEYHTKEKNLITVVCSLKHIRIPYGVIETSEDGQIEEMKEKPEFSFLANTGMYIVEPKVIEELKVGQAIGFPDVIENYKNKGERIGVYPISESAWLDMGQFNEMELMKKRLGYDG